MDYVGLYSYQFGHFLALCNGRVYLLYHHVDPSSIACNTYQVVSSDGIVYIIVCMSFELQVRCQQKMLRLGSPVDEGCLMKLQDRITLLRYDDESTFRAMPSVEVVAELEEKEKYKYTIDSVNNCVTLYLALAFRLGSALI